MLEEIAENNFRYDNSGLKGCFSDNFKINVNNNLTVYTILRAICNEKAIIPIQEVNTVI